MTTMQAPRRAGSLPGTDYPGQSSYPGQSPPPGRKAPAAPRRVAFWLLALVLGVTMLGTTLPTPLYVIYQARWHFSAAMVTVTFAVYAAAVIATLLLAGRASDQAGRRPVLAAALGASALSTVMFIVAPDLGTLIAARIVSGLSAGLMTGTATATLTELIPVSASRRASLVATAANMAGLGLGPLAAGLFAQYAPHPTTLVFQVYLAVLAVAALIVLLVPETVSRRTRPALRFAGLGIPERGRAEFIAASVAGFAAFALLGLFSSLVPGFLAGQLHQGSHAVQGAVVFLLLAVGAVIQVAVARLRSRRVMLAGLSLFVAALALIVAALAQSGMPLFLAGTVTGGVAVGAIFPGSLATANRLAPPERRGQAISAFFVACYAGLIIPVVGVGVLSEFTGTFPAVLTFSILLAAVCLFSVSRFTRGGQ
jgi:MFS family permease